MVASKFCSKKLSENYRTYSKNSVFLPPNPLARGNLRILNKKLLNLNIKLKPLNKFEIL